MATALSSFVGLLAKFNAYVLRVGRSLAWMALGLMVVVILLQVFFRYVLGNALAWPDEAARFLMLWMTGLAAPSAYRWGGFVAIEMLPSALPKLAAELLLLVLFIVSALVLLTAIGFGWNHTMGFGGNFDSSSLRLPLDWIGMDVVKVKLRYMYASLLVCIVLLLLVNIEHVLRIVFKLVRPDIELPEIEADTSAIAGAD